MVINKIIVVILSLLFFPKIYGIGNSDISKPQQIAYEVITNFAAKKSSEGLILCGIGGASKEGKRTGFELIFQIKQLYEVSEARKLLLKLTSEFLEDVNHNEKLRPHLSSYPYPVQNIRIAILCNVDFSERERYLASFSIDNGWIDYAKGYELDTGIINFDLDETYEEALKIVAASKEGK